MQTKKSARVFCFLGSKSWGLPALALLALLAGPMSAQAQTALTVTGLAADKVYDGSISTTLNTNGITLVGVAGGDVVYLVTNGCTATFANKNVGAGKTVTLTGSLTLGGANASSYTLIQPSITASITARPLGVSVSSAGKTYDATVNASVTLGYINLAPGDTGGSAVIAGYGSASYGVKAAGLQTITVTGLFIVGSAANNYALTNASQTATTTATISQKTLFVAAVGNDKTYDQTTAATVTLYDNHYSGDDVTTTNNPAITTFADKNVGTGKNISVGGISISGADAADYALNSTTASAQADITPATLSVTIAGVNKTYDGTTNATVTLTPVPFSGDSVSVSYSSAGFVNKGAATGKTVAVNGIVITGPDGGNYTSSTTLTTTANISARSLTVVANPGTDKIYDGTTNATVGTTVTLADNRIAGDSFTVSAGGAGFSDKNVGNGKTLTVSGISISGTDAVNYTLGNTIATTPANIVSRSLTVTATGVNKTYDGTTNATVSLLDNRVTGDSLSLSYTSASFADKNVANGKTVTVTGLQVTGGDAGNYALSSPTASTSANITGRTLNVAATGQNKTYDGTTNATVTLSDDHLAGDSDNTSYASAGFADQHVGNGKTITVTGISIGGANAGNYTLAATTATTSANITGRSLTISATGSNKVYDGNVSATVTLSDNRVAGDTFTDSYGSANFGDKSVGTGKPITITGLQVSGGNSADYSLSGTTATTAADITSKTLTITASGVNKVYDGTTNATVTLGDDRVAGDSLSDSYTGASFSDKNVGTGKTVSVVGLQITGSDSGNYALGNTTASTIANITGKTLTVVATGVNRTYDGTTNATVTLADNRITGDSVTDNYTNASFSDKNVGDGKTVTVTGIGVTGSDAVNYSLGNSTATTPANITARSLTVTATGQNKTYDGTTNATVTLGDNRVAGDSLTDSYGSANFADKNVGTGKPVNVLGIQVTGGDSGNYSLASTTASTTANINARPLTVAATGQDKTYDGLTNATVTLSDNHLTGDSVTTSFSSASFADKRVGSGKTITITGISLGGDSAGNYSLASSSATATANITPYLLTVTATGVNKVYDGTVTATVTLSDNRVAGDVFTASYGSASFTSSAVGNGKTVNVSGISLAGTDAGNYTLGNTTAATTANITAGTPSIALVSSDNPSGFHDAITFTATLPADATGTVAFSTNGVAFSSGSLSGGTFTSGSISNLLRGTNLITATYTSGDANYSSTAGSLSQVVTNHPPITGLFSFSVTNGNALKLQVSTLLSAVFDPDGDAVSLVGIGVSTNGVTLATNATMIYYRNTNYVNDLFSYTVYDGYNYTTGQVSVVSVTAPFLIGSASNGTITPNGVSNAVVFNGVPGFTYVIQRSTDIVHWTDIATQAAAADGTIQFNDSFTDLGSAPSQAFYRLKWQP